VRRYIASLPSEWECDIFIHAWNATSTPRNYQDAMHTEGHAGNYEHVYDIVELRDDLIEKYKPKSILVETKEVLRDLATYYKIKCSADQIISSNFLAMSQHISAERAANLKMGKDIILPGEDVVGDTSLNDYDIVIKTRFDVMFFPKRSQLIDVYNKISRFDNPDYERTPTGMTYFPSMTVRDGNLACEFGHFWSGNKQFDMIYTSFFRKLHNSTHIDIYTSCHHHAFATHAMNQGISMRQWRIITKPSATPDPEGGRDFIWVMPNAPKGMHPMSQYRECYKTYAAEHEQRMNIVDEDKRKFEEKLEKERRRISSGMKLVAQGIKKDVFYNNKTHFVDIKFVKKIDDTDVVELPHSNVVKWSNASQAWVTYAKQ
jgi:hypothetical protein